jgi:hypothetical protein
MMLSYNESKAACQIKQCSFVAQFEQPEGTHGAGVFGLASALRDVGPVPNASQATLAGIWR